MKIGAIGNWVKGESASGKMLIRQNGFSKVNFVIVRES